MTLLVQKTQIAAKIESVAGTVETPTASDVIKAVGEPAFTVNAVLFEDETINATIGELPQYAPNIGWVEIKFSIALAGHGASSSSGLTKTSWGKLVEACGFEALDGDSGTNAVKEFTIGAITSGPFRHGETVTSGTGESGVIIGDTWTGTTTLYVEKTGASDFDPSDLLTGGTSGATATISSILSYNPLAYRLLSDPTSPVTLTLAFHRDGKRMRIKGCRGNVVFRSDWANRAFLDFTFKGIFHDMTDTALLTGVSYSDRTAPACLGIGFALNDGSQSASLTLNKTQLDLGNNVVMIEDATNSDGWDPATVTGRSPRLSINPKEVLDATYPFVDNLKSGTTARARWTIGSVAGNTFVQMAPFLQAEGLTPTAENNIWRWDGTFRATKGSYVLSNLTTFGANNEFVLIYK